MFLVSLLRLSFLSYHGLGGLVPDPGVRRFFPVFILMYGGVDAWMDLEIFQICKIMDRTGGMKEVGAEV